MDRRKVLLIVAVVIAALGTMLVFLYVKGADNRAAQKFHAVRVLRAVKPIAAGETVAAAQAAGKIQMGNVSESQRLPDALSDLSTINSEVALTQIYPGEQIIASRFGATSNGTTLTIPKTKMAISVNLTDPARVAGFVNPGDNVAVFYNGTAVDGQPTTRLLLPRVQVIGVGTTTVVSTTKTDSTGAQTTEQLPRTLLTLALTQDQAQKVLFATSNGDVALGLLNDESQVFAGRGVSARNLF